jgi:hypothetical protein
MRLGSASQPGQYIADGWIYHPSAILRGRLLSEKAFSRRVQVTDFHFVPLVRRKAVNKNDDCFWKIAFRSQQHPMSTPCAAPSQHRKEFQPEAASQNDTQNGLVIPT